jgi:RNA polymerase-binding transcription factor DksA
VRPDPNDEASELEIAGREQAIAEIQQRLAPEIHPDFDGETCVECTADIPIARLKMGRVRCVDCQAAIERKSKGR